MTYDPKNAECPVCGYYCLGKGGFGCIDKPSLVNKEASPETKLIASQLQVKALREALTHISLCGRNSMSSRVECGKIANCALSQPTDTAEADALLARVKLLEDDKAFHAQDFQISQENERATHDANKRMAKQLFETEAKLSSARAVIEAAEKVLASLIPTGLGWAKLGPAGVDLAVRTRAHIREWKENRK